MKLTKKQEQIKAKILAGTHVLFADVKKSKIINCLNAIEEFDWQGLDKFYGIDNDDSFNYLLDKEIKDRPTINMSEWFEESEEPSESTKDMREYDARLLTNLADRVTSLDTCNMYDEIKFILNQRYPNEALLKEKSELEARLKEIEQRLKEIEEQLGSEG